MPQKPKLFVPPFFALPKSHDAIRGSSSERGYDAIWRRIRDAYIAAHPLCEVAGPNCTTLATLVDHKQPLTAGGARLDWDNLRSCCTNCHASITANYKATGVNELPGQHGAAVKGHNATAA